MWLIIPGLALLYGGLARRKSALAMLYQGFGVIGVSDLNKGRGRVFQALTQFAGHNIPVDVLGLHSDLFSKCQLLHR